MLYCYSKQDCISVEGAIAAVTLTVTRWPWCIHTWSRYSDHVPAYQQWTLYSKAFKKLEHKQDIQIGRCGCDLNNHLYFTNIIVDNKKK